MTIHTGTVCICGALPGQPNRDCERCRLVAEIDRLKAVVDRLPVTADNVSVIPGDTEVWLVNGPNVPPVSTIMSWRLFRLRGSDIYSTKEAAQKARNQ